MYKFTHLFSKFLIFHIKMQQDMNVVFVSKLLESSGRDMDDVSDEDFIGVFKAAGHEIDDVIVKQIKEFRICDRRNMEQATMMQVGLYDYRRLLYGNEKYDEIRRDKFESYFKGEYDEDEDEYYGNSDEENENEEMNKILKKSPFGDDNTISEEFTNYVDNHQEITSVGVEDGKFIITLDKNSDVDQFKETCDFDLQCATIKIESISDDQCKFENSCKQIK